MTIHFICRGNAFRSVMAEAYLNSLQLEGVKTISSGTVASAKKEETTENFRKFLGLLEGHGIREFAKDEHGEDLTQDRLDASDIAIFMNKRAYDEASGFKLPERVYVWDVVDAGEGAPPPNGHEELMRFAEDTYQDLVENTDEFVRTEIKGAS